MSLEVVRDALLDEKKKQIRLATVARTRGLLELFRAAFSPQNFGASLPTPVGLEEQRFLEDNDITKSRYLNEASIPTLSAVARQLGSAATVAQPSKSLLSANGPNATASSSSPPLEAPAALPTQQLSSSSRRTEKTADPVTSGLSDGQEIAVATIGGDLASPSLASALLGDRALESGTGVTASTSSVNDPHLDEASQKISKSVRLPSSRITTDFAQDAGRRKERKDDDGVQSGAGDLASSPSSTTGAHSTFTPKATNHSPDTSPDIEAREIPPVDASSLRSDGRSLADASGVAAKAEQTGQSFDQSPVAISAGDQDRPEDQLRREEEEVARKKGSRQIPKDSELTQRAEQVVEQTQLAEVAVQQAISEESTEDAMPAMALVGTPARSDRDQRSAQQQSSDVNPAEPATVGTPEALPTPERMSTRVSTGAIRHRSVTELLGGKPILTRPGSDGDAGIDSSPSRTPVTPVRRDPSRPSTALITKNDMVKTVKPLRNISEDYAALRGASTDETKDYLTPLFIYQASQPPKTKHSLQELMATAHKTLTTSGFQAVSREVQDYRILKRIYHLQFANRWSLRQMEIAQEPQLPKTSLDHLLEEMKWMRTDFREERKFKAVMARTLASWCRNWMLASPAERKSLQVSAKIPSGVPPEVSLTSEDLEQPPDLVPSGTNETDSEFSLEELSATPPPATPSFLFAMGFDQIQFELESSPVIDNLLQSVPSYIPKLPPQFNVNQRTIIPVSKLSTAKLVYTSQGPPKKRSRFEYEEEEPASSYDSNSKRRELEGPYSLTPTRRSPKLEVPPEQSDLALFLSENKHVRDRLHAGHAFRPPSEFGMPSTSFFESRSSSQWHWDEDQELRGLVKEYSYNWSLIASCLSKNAVFSSAAERRTPWECFERWVQLEGLPPEMGKTQYFRTYQARLEAAARTVNAAFMAQQQQALMTPNQAVVGPRRRTTQPFRVEKRKSSKHLAMLDVFRKNAKKREINMHKTQENAKAAQLRKTQEVAQQKPAMHTPAELSRMRFERDQKLAEKIEENRQRYIAAQRNAVLQRQAGGQMSQNAAAHANLQQQQQQQRNVVQSNAQGQVQQVSAMAANLQGNQMQNGVQVRMPQNGASNGLPNNAAIAARMAGMQGGPTPQQMQAIMATQQRMNSASSEQQMQYLLQQQQRAAQMQQMQLNQPGGLANAHLMGASAANPMNNPAFVAAMTKQMNMNNGGGSNGNNGNNNNVGGMTNGTMPSPNPRMAQEQGRGQPLSSGHVPAINQLAAQIQLNNPTFSQEQVQRLAANQLIMQNSSKNQFANARQHALNAAAGSPGMVANNMPMNMAMNMNLNMNMSNMNMANMNMNGMPIGFNGSTPSVGGSPSMANVGMNVGVNGHGQGSVSPVQSQAYSRQMAIQQQAAMQRQMAGSPAVGLGMNGSGMSVSSRSATPQQSHQRVGSGNAIENGLSPGASGRPASMHGAPPNAGSVPPGSR